MTPAASYQWSAPTTDDLGSVSRAVDFDGSNNAYVGDGAALIKINPSGAVTWAVTSPSTRLIYSVAIDDANGWGYYGLATDIPGPFSSGYQGPTLIKFSLTDGSTLAVASIAGGGAYVSDLALDGSDGVYASVAGLPVSGIVGGIFHFDNTLAELSPVGCTRDTLRLAVDTDKNLYAVGPDPCTTTILGCSIQWNVLKFDDAGTLVNGTNYFNPTAVAWHGGKLYVGYDGRVDRDAATNTAFCTLVALDSTTFLNADSSSGCLWTARLERSGESEPPHPFDRIVDIAATADHVYAVAGKYLYAVSNSAGTLDWARKNQATDSDPGMTVRSANYYAVAANVDFVWVVGGATPCVEGTNDDAESDSCTESRCDCSCRDTKAAGTTWNTGKNNGFIVDDCGCAEVPCTAKVYVAAGGCLSGLPAYVNTTRTFTSSMGVWSEKWTGTTTFSCGMDSWNITFEPYYLCGTGWAMDITISRGGSTATFPATIVSTFCSGIDGHPGFTWTLDISAGDFSSLGLSACCTVGVSLCGGFGDTGCEVDACGCTGIPRTLHTEVTDECETHDPVTLTYNASAIVGGIPRAAWQGSSTPWACGIASSCSGTDPILGSPRTFKASLYCLDGDWYLRLDGAGEGGMGSGASEGPIISPVLNCSPFELFGVFGYPPFASCQAANFSIVITA